MKRIFSKTQLLIISLSLSSCWVEFDRDYDYTYELDESICENIVFRNFHYTYSPEEITNPNEFLDTLDVIIAYAVRESEFEEYECLNNGNEYVPIQFPKEWQAEIPIYSIIEIDWKEKICLRTKYEYFIYKSEA